VFSNIVVGTDGSETAKLALALASDLAIQHGAVLHVVNVYKVPAGGAGVVQAGPMALAHVELGVEIFESSSKDILAEAVKLTGAAKVETHSRKGEPANTLIKVATEVGADVIVVGSKGMRGARRMIGSVPNSVAHRAPCHVLVAKTD